MKTIKFRYPAPEDSTFEPDAFDDSTNKIVQVRLTDNRLIFGRIIEVKVVEEGKAVDVTLETEDY